MRCKPVRLPDKAMWARFAAQRGYPASHCDRCMRETRILHQRGAQFICTECKEKLNGRA